MPVFFSSLLHRCTFCKDSTPCWFDNSLTLLLSFHITAGMPILDQICGP